MKVIVIASGSKGNATYIEYQNTRILIDAGVTAKRIKEELAKYKTKCSSLDAILVTHEHSDHIKCLERVSNIFHADVYMSPKSIEGASNPMQRVLDSLNVYELLGEVKYQIGDLIVVPITLSHDTNNVFGFLIKAGNESIAYLTDTGEISDKYIKLLRQMHYLIIESNHDEQMLLESDRDYMLKKRILSKYGHLSNHQCAEYLRKIISEKTKVIMLAHLSEECNTEALAAEANSKVIEEAAYKPTLLIAKQHESVVLVDD